MAGRLPSEPPRGMRDILPAEAELRDATAGTILGVYRRHGFRRIETPALESLELLTGGGGGENEKLIFKVLKRGEKLDLGAATTEADLADLGLRFDLTVPLARYYAQNHAKLPEPLRAVQIGPVWRAERPQRGRYRQFTQCDIDILGVASEIAEIELILATTEALGALGLEGLTVRINDRRLLAAMASLVRLRAGAPRERLHHARQVGQALAGEIRRELEQAGHPAAAIGRMLALYTGRRPRRTAWRACGSRLRRPERGRRVPGARRVSSRPWARRRAAGSASTSTRRSCGAWATTPGRSSRSARRASPTGSIAGGGRYDGMIGRMLGPGRPGHGVLHRLRARRGHSRPARAAGAARDDRRIAVLFDEAAQELGGGPAGGRRRSGAKGTSWRSSARRGTRARSGPRWRSRATRASPRSAPRAGRACNGSPIASRRRPGSRT